MLLKATSVVQCGLGAHIHPHTVKHLAVNPSVFISHKLFSSAHPNSVPVPLEAELQRADPQAELIMHWSNTPLAGFWNMEPSDDGPVNLRCF